MNNDRRTIAGVLGAIAKVYSTERTVPHKVLIVLHEETKKLTTTEQLGIKKMEPHKDSPTTASNYHNAVAAWEDLSAAEEALSEGELDEAYPLLLRVATPPETKPAPVAPVKKGRRK